MRATSLSLLSLPRSVLRISVLRISVLRISVLRISVLRISVLCISVLRMPLILFICLALILMGGLCKCLFFGRRLGAAVAEGSNQGVQP